MLAMARALATDPALLLLDELSMGLAPLVVEQLYEIVAQHRQGRRLDPRRRAVRPRRARHRRLRSGSCSGAGSPSSGRRPRWKPNCRPHIWANERRSMTTDRIHRSGRAVQGRDRRHEVEDGPGEGREPRCRSLGVVLMVGGIVHRARRVRGVAERDRDPGDERRRARLQLVHAARDRGAGDQRVGRLRVPALLARDVPAVLAAAPVVRAARRDRRGCGPRSATPRRCPSARRSGRRSRRTVRASSRRSSPNSARS